MAYLSLVILWLTEEKECFSLSNSPDKKEDPSSSLVEKIQQLGQTNVAASNDSPIHVLSIIGQVEGHIQLPPQNKTTKYEHLIPHCNRA